MINIMRVLQSKKGWVEEGWIDPYYSWEYRSTLARGTRTLLKYWSSRFTSNILTQGRQVQYWSKLTNEKRRKVQFWIQIKQYHTERRWRSREIRYWCTILKQLFWITAILERGEFFGSTHWNSPALVYTVQCKEVVGENKQPVGKRN